MNDLIRQARQHVDLQTMRRLADRLGRAPTTAECNKAGVYFGNSAPFQRLNDAVERLELTPRISTKEKAQLDADGEPIRKRGRLPKTRRCDCGMRIPHVDNCPHCGLPWIRSHLIALELGMSVR